VAFEQQKSLSLNTNMHAHGVRAQ